MTDSPGRGCRAPCFRSDDWPKQVGLSGLRRYIRLGREYAAKKGVKPNV